MNHVTFLALLHIFRENLLDKDFLQSPDSIFVGILSYWYGIYLNIMLSLVRAET